MSKYFIDDGIHDMGTFKEVPVGFSFYCGDEDNTTIIYLYKKVNEYQGNMDGRDWWFEDDTIIQHCYD